MSNGRPLRKFSTNDSASTTVRNFVPNFLYLTEHSYGTCRVGGACGLRSHVRSCSAAPLTRRWTTQLGAGRQKADSPAMSHDLAVGSWARPTAVARRLGVSDRTIRKWCAQWQERPTVEALRDSTHPRRRAATLDALIH